MLLLLLAFHISRSETLLSKSVRTIEKIVNLSFDANYIPIFIWMHNNKQISKTLVKITQYVNILDQFFTQIDYTHRKWCYTFHQTHTYRI